jgi:hypothetical protein
MSNRHHHLHELLRQDLAKLKLRWYRRWIRPYFHRFLRPCYFPSDVLRPLLLKRAESLLPFVRNISLVSFFVYFTLFSLVATAAML